MDQQYREAVKIIKTAILQSQYKAARYVNESQLRLYFDIGKYVSLNSRKGYWGKGAIDEIGKQLERELPGLKGFSVRNIRYMRTFYEEWKMLDNSSLFEIGDKKSILALASAEIESSTNNDNFFSKLSDFSQFPAIEFMSIGFTHHRVILSKSKDIEERIYYIRNCANNNWGIRELERLINDDLYHHQGQVVNNFGNTISQDVQALKAINTFKDEYLLDYINVEELDIRDTADIDERVVENSIVNNIKNFILAFGKDFAFISNQYHIEALGEDQYIDLLFFNRELNCLVAVELKTGKFKTAYLGQLQGYLSVLDGYDRKPHENPAIGLILCKDMNKSFVDYVIRDYSKPMGVATYKTSKDMSEQLKNALPPIEELQRILDEKSVQQIEQEQMARLKAKAKKGNIMLDE